MMQEKAPRLAKPETPQDSAYLTMRYEEDAEHARLHETLRAAVTGLMMTLIAGLLAFAVEASDDHSGKQWVTGILVCGASFVGILFNWVHNSRYEMHLQKLKAFREALEDDLSPSLRLSIKPVIDAISKKRGPSLRGLWFAIYIFTCLIGGIMAALSAPPEGVCSKAPFVFNCRNG
jgi:ATP/ADP translocase